MTLSEETIEERYGRFTAWERIQAMVQDACDTELIMQAVQRYGSQRYDQGVQDGMSRSSVRPGFGDMGG
jgi:hypothetical protein